MIDGISAARAAPPLSINQTARVIETIRESQIESAKQQERAAAAQRAQ